MIQQFADWLIYGLCGLDAASRLGAALNFFVYDSIKIVLLFFAISFLMGIVNAYFPVERLRNFLTTHKLFGLQYLLAALFGAITPFCSCSSIPLFIGFVKGGIPLGVTFAFLITSPLVNEIAVAMLAATFGWKVTVIYVTSGILMGAVLGAILGKFKLERLLSPWVRQIQEMSAQMAAGTDTKLGDGEPSEAPRLTFFQRLPGIARGSLNIVRGVILYVIIGIGIGAAMHGYVPTGFFENFLSSEHWYAVPLAVILAVPMYSNAAGVVPIIEVLVAKGVAIGTALSFMMAVVGLSLPEAMMLKKVMSLKLLLIFFGTVALSIIVLGLLFNGVGV